MWRVDQEEFVTIPRRQEGEDNEEVQTDRNQEAESCNCYNNSIETITYSTAPKATVSNVSSSQPTTNLSIPTDQENSVETDEDDTSAHQNTNSESVAAIDFTPSSSWNRSETMLA